MIRSILLGLDNSTYGDASIALGIRWAKRFDAVLGGLGIIDEPAIRRPELVPIGASHYKEHRDQVLLERATSQVESLLDGFARQCTEAGIVHRRLEDVGSAAETILLEAQSYDVIVLGQQSHFQFASPERTDSTLTDVLKNTPRPVIAVPETFDDKSTVVIAYDGSLQAARALQAFESTGLAKSGDVHVVSVGADPAETARHAERAVDFLTFHGVKAVPRVLNPRGEATAEILLRQAESLDAGLLVMGCYGQPTFREFFLGSVTRSLLGASRVPLFLYH
jgi:nucleotide-binding universal stress UspA family protein